MSILQKLKAIRLFRDRKVEQKQKQEETPQQQQQQNQQREEVEEKERVFDISKKSRPPSIFIQLGAYEVVHPTEAGDQQQVNSSELQLLDLDLDENKDYETLIMKAWEESVDDSEVYTKNNNNHFYEQDNRSLSSLSLSSEDEERERQRRLALRKVAVRQSRILSVLSYQAREISRARDERRPISLIITPTKSAMKRSSMEEAVKGMNGMNKVKERRSLTIIDPRDPLNPHPVICRKEFLEELRAQNRLSFNSSDFKLLQPNPKGQNDTEDEEKEDKEESK